ncbi:MAG: TetM/TetW/TetO/TetS family tetracycline resistance ribosomal protection protein [Lachnospiraceae bacterium]|nr:TetM/TetW/TetO/TetS family tetracycline resistance ribosomal protection protein [Lachnospiraceae bacterium]
MKKIVVGILAHVDAGKTTLSEAMLYTSGNIRTLGRVDNKDAFLDTYTLERERGITIFSKQALMTWQNVELTLLDTPGHVDFSAEMERTLQVLDYAILVISGADGVQGHTQTLWRLLKQYHIPTFLFINKMDQDGTDREVLLEECRMRLQDVCIDFTEEGNRDFYETVAMCDETALEQFLETDRVEAAYIRQLIADRKLFPCYFGSALKLSGVEAFLHGLEQYTLTKTYPEQFGAKIFKITRDEQGNRLTHMKITGGSLKVKTTPTDDKEEKVNQIRLYSGGKYEMVNEIKAGSICAVTGLNSTCPGQGLGIENASAMPILVPVLTYRLELPPTCDVAVMLPKLRQLEEEEPQLHIVWNENLQEIQIQMMGEVQIDIVKHLIEERFGVEVAFGTGNIVYKETISNRVEGVGHFEPLRHYAEVHLLLEPGEPGSGLQFMSNCSEDDLDKNWQRLIMTHLEEKEHKGVLTGSAITDMRITLIAGRAHLKHTEGGDFRQATYRALRQGLKQAESILLEPVYEFTLEVPESVVGRAMSDIDKMQGTFVLQQSEVGTAVLKGSVPVIRMRDYQKEVASYTKGHGRLFCTFAGYAPCHNAEEVITQIGYDSERDLDNPTGSVFCAHGAGFVVGWEQVKEYMHIPSPLSLSANVQEKQNSTSEAVHTGSRTVSEWIDVEEIDAILARTAYANTKGKTSAYKKTNRQRTDHAAYSGTRTYNPIQKEEEYLLVDGYNIIYAWDSLKELTETNMEGARGKLLDMLCNYQAVRGCKLIVVFDAYKVKGHDTTVMDYHNIHVVYTKEAETADQYIEKFAHENSKKYRVIVATSDGLEQVIIRGQGAILMSARELYQEMTRAGDALYQEYKDAMPKERNYALDSKIAELAEHLQIDDVGKEVNGVKKGEDR